jgi:poly(3-hydroxybutyrate) depolymerase
VSELFGGSPGKTGTFYDSVQVAGLERTFYVSVPASYDSKKRYPLIFGYHGGTDYGGKAMRNYLRLETVAPLASEIFVYPDATAVNDPKGAGFEYGTGPEGQAEDAFFDALLAAMKKKYCIDANRVFVTGQSAGGGYATQLACHRGDVVRAAVPVAANLVLCNNKTCSGWGTDPSNCVGKANVMLMHSPDDWIKLKPFGLGTLEFLASAAGCGAWSNKKVEISKLGTAPTEKIQPAPCVRRLGCDREIIFCPYAGGHQIPSWYPQAGFKYEQFAMDFFRSH